jgi:superfamily II DNA or RNA helicase
MKQIDLYEWQEICISKWFSLKCRGIAQVATGSGKTIMAISAALKLKEENKNLKIKIVVPKAFLVDQWKSSLIEDFQIDKNDIGCYYGKEKCLDSKPFMIYVINSARYTLALKILEERKQGNSHLLILDECHHYSSQENSKIFEFLSNKNYDQKYYFSLGLSATPQTLTSSYTTEQYIGPIFYKYSIKSAMTDDIINGCVLYNVKLDFTDEERKQYTEVSDSISKLVGMLYRAFPEKKDSKMNHDQFLNFLKKIIRIGDEDISNLAKSIINKFLERQNIVYNAHSRISAVVNLVDMIFDGKKIIIFTERITQTNKLFSILSKIYIGKVVRYHSKMDEDEKQLALESYRIGQSSILITCKSLDEGLNIPSSDIGIILSGNSQERQRVQRLGRILRKNEGKKLSSLFYCYLSNSVEKGSLLNEAFTSDMEFDIKYDYDLESFSFPYYNLLTAEMLCEIDNNSLIPFFNKYFDEGTYENDWLEPLSFIEKQMDKATNRDRKNYWYCMKKLSLFRIESRKTQ